MIRKIVPQPEGLRKQLMQIRPSAIGHWFCRKIRGEARAVAERLAVEHDLSSGDCEELTLRACRMAAFPELDAGPRYFFEDEDGETLGLMGDWLWRNEVFRFPDQEPAGLDKELTFFADFRLVRALRTGVVYEATALSERLISAERVLPKEAFTFFAQSCVLRGGIDSLPQSLAEHDAEFLAGNR